LYIQLNFNNDQLKIYYSLIKGVLLS